MIGNPNWFSRRKYTGWGLTPSTWQGWVYVGVVIAIVALLQLLPLAGMAKTIATAAIILLVIVDVIDMMRRMKKDEREMKHEAIAERNAMWMMIAVLIIGAGYQAANSVAQDLTTVDPIIFIALAGALVVKAVSNIYLDRTD
jgi:hypothetical protein